MPTPAIMNLSHLANASCFIDERPFRIRQLLPVLLSAPSYILTITSECSEVNNNLLFFDKLLLTSLWRNSSVMGSDPITKLLHGRAAW